MDLGGIVRKLAFPLALATAACGSVPQKPTLPSVRKDYCVEDELPGKRSSRVHVVYQTHNNPVTDELSDDGVLSQVHVFRMVRALLDTERVGYALVEGYPQKKDILDFARKNNLNIDKVAMHFAEDVGISTREFTEGSRAHPAEAAQDYIIGHYLFYGPYTPHFLLAHMYPHVVFEGFENGINEVVIDLLRKYQKGLVKHRDGKPVSAGEMRAVLLEYGDKARSRLAVAVAIEKSRYGGEGIIVIGKGHDATLREYLTSVPAEERPTFVFHHDACDDEPYITPADVRLIRENQASALYECLADSVLKPSGEGIEPCRILQRTLGIKAVDERRLEDTLMRKFQHGALPSP